MRSTYFWHQLHLHGYKIILVLSLMASVFNAEAQKTRWVQKNNPNYDDRKLTYGFLIGLHTTTYQLKYSDAFVTQSFDSVHSVSPNWKPGFSLGFIVNYKLTDFLDLRLTPKVAFNEHEVIYRYIDDTAPRTARVETTMVEFPLLLKYKSERRGNIRMYMIGGVKPGIKASGKEEDDGLQVKDTNISLDAGFGFDLYYPLFKFSPEIRFSRGIVNLLDNTDNAYGQPLKYINTNTITVYLLFQ